MNVESPSSGRKTLLLATVVLQVVLALILARIYDSGRNSLRNNGNWISTKAELARGVMGAVSFVYGLQPLAGGHLDLSAWHGYQELLSKDGFDPSAVEFRLFIKQHGHLSVLFQKPDGGYSGLRISKNRIYPSMLFSATRDGEFTFKREIKKLRRFKTAAWHTFRLELDGERLAIFRNGEELKSAEFHLDSPVRVGFRGGKAPVLVDEIRIEQRDGKVFRESFNRPGNWLPVILVCTAIVLGLSVVLFLALRRSLTISDTQLLAYFLMFTGVLVIISLMLLGYASYTKRFYPDHNAMLEREEEYWRESLEEAVRRRLENEYRHPPDPGTRRVLFLGSSQTHGSGAATAEETLVRQTERLLNALPGGQRFECLNAAVSSYRVEDMVRGYLDRWIDLEPSIVILNASNNDIGYGQGQFARWLRKLAERSQERGIELVLVMEPNSPERHMPTLRQFHGIMQRAGEHYGLVVVDMHEQLREHYDDGVLWWDWVHLTSFGQRLFAERLVGELSRLVDVPPDRLGSASQPHGD